MWLLLFVAQLCLTLWDPVDCSMPGFPVLHHLPEFAQTHVCWVSDAISTIIPSVTPFSSHLQSFPVSESFPVSWLFASGSPILELQHQSFQWIFRADFLYDWLVGSPCSPRDSQEFSPTPRFKSINSLAPSLLYGPTLTSICNFL